MSNDEAVYEASKVIYENVHYRIEMGKSTHDGEGIACYKVINIQTELVEMEVTVLPTAIQYADEFSKTLASIEKVNTPTPLSIH